MVLDVLSEFIGKDIVVDYSTHSDSTKIIYAKGKLIAIEGEKLIIRSPTRFWAIDKGSILNFRVKTGQDIDGTAYLDDVELPGRGM